jgi:hypothetical protein
MGRMIIERDVEGNDCGLILYIACGGKPQKLQPPRLYFNPPSKYVIIKGGKKILLLLPSGRFGAVG